MSIEDTLAALLDTKLVPLRLELERVRGEVAALRGAMPPQFGTLHQAAALLGISYGTARRRAKNGDLPVRRFGRTLRVDFGALHVPSEAEVVRLAVAARKGP